MNNKEKIKDYQKKIFQLEKLSKEFNKGNILAINYEKHLVSEIEYVKSNTIRDIEYNIKKDLSEIKMLKEIKYKLKHSIRLNNFEENYILLNI
ncbi:hypothetical protein PL372_12095 [Tenacibaculum dicentrarchi]|nr:hypothetical protein [Tenacibaculum dicentrarchi]